MIPSAAVFAAAVEDAEGFPIRRMPISPSELHDLRLRHAAGELRALRRRTPSDDAMHAEDTRRRRHQGHRGDTVKVSGTATLHAPREKVWAALNDPAVLVRTIPGCQQLEEVGRTPTG